MKHEELYLEIQRVMFWEIKETFGCNVVDFHHYFYVYRLSMSGGAWFFTGGFMPLVLRDHIGTSSNDFYKLEPLVARCYFVLQAFICCCDAIGEQRVSVLMYILLEINNILVLFLVWSYFLKGYLHIHSVGPLLCCFSFYC